MPEMRLCLLSQHQNPRRDGVADLDRGTLATQIRSPNFAPSQHLAGCLLDQRRRLILPEVLQHHAAGQDRRDGVRDSLSRDVRAATMDWLEHRGATLGVDVATWRHPHAADDSCAQVGYDVSKEV